MNKKVIRILACLAWGVIFVLTFHATAPRAHAATDGRLIDDVVFDNASTMSAGDIQGFLNQFPNSCLKNYTDAMPDANPVNAYFNYSGIGSAAQIIRRVADDYGVNPRVILTKLQQEQSLVTGNAGCAGWRYTGAMGFNCPEGSSCPANSANAGFARQVTRGMWLLKMSKERANGNLSWMVPDDASWVYGGPMTQGYRRRCGTCSLIYFDGYWNNVYLQTGATASLYNYTPHIPSSFPTIWESWWGAGSTWQDTVGFVTQSAYPSMLPGRSATAYIEYKNNGASTWYDDTGLSGAPAGTQPVHLATSNPINRASPFGSAWGAGQNRPGLNFSAVYESDGSTLATNQHAASPGQIIKYSFTFNAPANIGPGVYREFFKPILEGSPDNAMNDPGTYLDVTVQAFSYIPAFYGQSAYPNLLPGQSTTAYLEYKNVGNQTWYDDTGLSGAPAGTLPMHLATSHPINRGSPFGSAWGGNQNRPNVNFSAVYESDGSTPASNQHAVAPGQVAKFSFNVTAPANIGAGTYREFYQPILEGSSDGDTSDPGTYLDVTVQPPIYADGFYSQSGYPTIARGNSATGFFMFKNTGNQSWYDDTGISGAPSGTLPAHFATSNPINRNSPFGSAWGANHNRPNFTFTAVYQSDGTTLAGSQHVVAPGQIAKFSFTFNVPSSLTPGVYREFFRPILEGSGDGILNDVGAYLDVTVQ